MTRTIEDYYPPLDGHLDTRRLALFADNAGGLPWAAEGTGEKAGLYTVAVTLGEARHEGTGESWQAACDAATDKAIAALGA